MRALVRPRPERSPSREDGAGTSPTGLDSDWQAHAATWNHRVVVHLLARGLTLDDAVDVAQTTWTRLIALDQAGRLPYVKMPGLALQQARFLAATLKRDRSGREQVTDVSDLSVVVDENAADAERTTIARDRVARALEEIGRLPPASQAVFRRTLGDPPPKHKEVAEAVGISEQRVRQIVCEVRARLRNALRETP